MPTEHQKAQKARSKIQKAARKQLARTNSEVERDPSPAAVPGEEAVEADDEDMYLDSLSEDESDKKPLGDLSEPVAKRANTGGESSGTATIFHDTSDPATVAPPPADLQKTLQQMMEMMQIQNTKMNERFDCLIAKTDGASASCLAKVETIDNKLTETNRRLDLLEQETKARFAAQSSTTTSSSGQPAPRGPPAPLGPSASAPAKAKPAWTQQGSSSWTKEDDSAPHSARASPAPAGKNKEAVGTIKFVAVGFPRQLPSAAFKLWWESTVLLFPKDIQDTARFLGGSGRACSISLPSRDEARRFTGYIANHGIAIPWVSPRAGEGSYPIAFKPERTVPERDRGRALQHAWGLLSKLVQESEAFLPGMKFSTDTKKPAASIAVIAPLGADMWPLVTLRPGNGLHTIETHDINLKYFGVPTDVIEALRTIVAAPAVQ
jgi:hypothetical protein